MNQWIPPATRQELAMPASTGGRHEQMLKVVPSLLGQGLTAEAVFAQLRGMYGADVPDREIVDVIRWASRRTFTPCAPRFAVTRFRQPTKSVLPQVNPVASIQQFLGDFTANEPDLWHESPWKPGEDWRQDSLLFVAAMFHGGELVNIVTEHSPEGKPVGYGLTLERDAMIRHLREHGTPTGRAGGWIRMNPVDGKGVADANVTTHRFALIEFDAVPVDVQMSLLARLPLPVNAIVLSVGKSVHAVIRINAPDAETYRAVTGEILSRLRRFGTDQANKNPSRLCRLPGAQREIGANGDGQQRLLYLAADRTDSKTILGGPAHASH